MPVDRDYALVNDIDLPAIPATVQSHEKLVERRFSSQDTDRIIEMAWEDRTTFDAIKFQFDLSEAEVKAFMKKNLKFSSYKLWRKRVENCRTKHAKTRVEGIERFKSSLQRSITLNKISKKNN